LIDSIESPEGSAFVEPLRALYGSSIAAFLDTPHDQILGTLVANAAFSILETPLP
jgi:hypothetical protein